MQFMYYCTICVSYQIHKIAGWACAGNAGNVFPATDYRGNRWLTIPTCITARASRTCLDACRDRYPAVTGKTFPGSRRMHNPHFYVSGKKHMARYDAFEDVNSPRKICTPFLLRWCLFIQLTLMNDLPIPFRIATGGATIIWLPQG